MKTSGATSSTGSGDVVARVGSCSCPACARHAVREVLASPAAKTSFCDVIDVEILVRIGELRRAGALVSPPATGTSVVQVNIAMWHACGLSDANCRQKGPTAAVGRSACAAAGGLMLRRGRRMALMG